ncbi:MAG: class I SAM-dependent methyltransferase [Halocynthiibacter sp.]
MDNMKSEFVTETGASDAELDRRAEFTRLFEQNPIPTADLLQNMGLFLSRQSLSRILTMHALYQKILDVHGVIMEFGVRWGQNLALFVAFRGIYEPYNHNRKIIGFDTFEGFPSVHEKDGEGQSIQVGGYGVTENYQAFLAQVLDHHQTNSPIAHKKKYELVRGDATSTLETYLREHPETIVSFAYFDFDIYEPTKVCLDLLQGCMTKGTVLAFDELNHPAFPGETLALKETLGLGRYALKRFPFDPLVSYLVID